MQYLCIVHVHMYMHTYALCGYTRHLRTCRNAAIQVKWHLSTVHKGLTANNVQTIDPTYYILNCILGILSKQLVFVQHFIV